MFSRSLASTVAIAAFASGAMAADLPARKSPPPAPYTAAPPIFTWTGFYAGVDGGVDFLRTTGNFANIVGGFPGTYGINSTAGLLGGYVGYNYQMGSVVLGVEGNLEGVLGGKTSVTATDTANNLYRVSTSSTYNGDLRLRAGYAFDRALLYLAGGFAFGDAKSQILSLANNNLLSVGSQRTGWTLGGGVDYAFTNNWIGRLEYRYTDLGSKSFANAAFNGSGKSRVTSNAVLVGVAYKF